MVRTYRKHATAKTHPIRMAFEQQLPRHTQSDLPWAKIAVAGEAVKRAKPRREMGQHSDPTPRRLSPVCLLLLVDVPDLVDKNSAVRPIVYYHLGSATESSTQRTANPVKKLAMPRLNKPTAWAR